MNDTTNSETLRKIDVPQSSVGAPCPRLAVDESGLTFGYFVERNDPCFKGDHPRSTSGTDGNEVVAVIHTDRCFALQFGLPNDEAIHGHRLYAIGLEPYSAFEVLNSAWIRSLELANRVHPRHYGSLFSNARHFIFTFHDSTLEFISAEFSVRHGRGSVRAVLKDVTEAIG